MGQRHTLVHQLADWAERQPSAPAMYGRDAAGRRQTITWAEYWDQARAFAKAIIQAGHQVGDAVAIMGNNRPEWVIAQLGTMTAGGVPAPIYPTSTPEQIAHIFKNSGAKIAVVDQPEHLERLLDCERRGLIEPEVLVRMSEGPAEGKVQRFPDFLASGRRAGGDDEVDSRMAGLGLNDTGLFIYTSGTTGVAKGAELTHGNLVSMGRMLEAHFPVLQQFSFKTVSYLPLSHIAEQIFTNFMHLARGGEVYFCEDMTKIKDALLEARPSLFVGVPRVWEKFEAALGARFAEATGVKAKLAGWARQTELQSFQAQVAKGQSVDGLARRMAQKLVISKVKAALGLDNVTMAASGAAPISRTTLEFFASLGIPIHEGYGMTETTGLVTASPYLRQRFGSVGKVLPGVELQIASDGEILARGENMTKGYFKMPEQTQELFDAEGWLHTGDLGRLDDEGFLWITGRKKDLLITAGGKNVAPSEMEQHLIAIPGVGQVVVVGDRKPYLSALFALDPEAVPRLCKEAGVEAAPVEKLAKNEAVRAYVERQIEVLCNQKVARYQTIKKFELLPTPFSVETGEMTPSMKVKRNVVNDKYADLIESMYVGD